MQAGDEARSIRRSPRWSGAAMWSSASRRRAAGVCMAVGVVAGVAACGEDSTDVGVCRPDQLSVAIGYPQGATGSITAPVSLKLAHGPPCSLVGDLRLAVERGDGTLVRSISGNPATKH